MSISPIVWDTMRLILSRWTFPLQQYVQYMPPSKFFKLHSKSEFTIRGLVLSCKSFCKRTMCFRTHTSSDGKDGDDQ